MPESQAVNIRNRSYRDRRARRHPRAGRRGRALRPRLALRRPRPLRQGQPAALRLQLRRVTSRRSSATEDLPIGDNLILAAAFEKDGEDPPGVSTGILSLYHGDTKVGEGRIKTQPGKFMLAGEGLCVGRDSGEPVTDDYPGVASVRVHRRHDRPRRGRRQRRAVRRPRARGRSDARPRVVADLNVLGGVLAPCGTDPVTGFFRDGCCHTSPEDPGSHTVCAVVTTEFLDHQQRIGNDLVTPMPQYRFPGLVPGDRWCVDRGQLAASTPRRRGSLRGARIHTSASARDHPARRSPRARRRRPPGPWAASGLSRA